MPRYQIIVNPISGRGAGLAAVPAIKAYLDGKDLSYNIQLTERPGHAIELARAAVKAGYEVVAGAGGDGTANEIINGLMQARIAGLGDAIMGVLAVGRGNDFAFGMNIPAGLELGLQTLVTGYHNKIDIGLVCGGDYPQGRYFGNGVGIGFDAVVGFEALKITWLSGFPNYIVATLKTIFLYYHAPLVRLDYDGHTENIFALMVSVMNGRRMGGGFMMAPESDNLDGLLDLCIARQVSRGRIFALIPHFLKGDQASQPSISTARAKRLEVTALEGSLPVHADGETICIAGDSLTIELLPAQISLICHPVDKSA